MRLRRTASITLRTKRSALRRKEVRAEVLRSTCSAVAGRVDMVVVEISVMEEEMNAKSATSVLWNFTSHRRDRGLCKKPPCLIENPDGPALPAPGHLFGERAGWVAEPRRAFRASLRK